MIGFSAPSKARLVKKRWLSFSRKAAAAWISIGLMLQSAAIAQDLLTISGGPDAAGNTIDQSYDLADLQALPKTTFATKTIWTTGIQRFEGVELKALLDAINVTSGTLVARAINDYRVEIPVAEITLGGALIAYQMNGARMPVREKGPLWIVYPYDSDRKYQSEVVFSRSVWQLSHIEIIP